MSETQPEIWALGNAPSPRQRLWWSLGLLLTASALGLAGWWLPKQAGMLWGWGASLLIISAVLAFYAPTRLVIQDNQVSIQGTGMMYLQFDLAKLKSIEPRGAYQLSVWRLRTLDGLSAQFSVAGLTAQQRDALLERLGGTSKLVASRDSLPKTPRQRLARGALYAGAVAVSGGAAFLLLLLLLPGASIENPLTMAAIALGVVVLVLCGFCIGAGWDRPFNSERS